MRKVPNTGILRLPDSKHDEELWPPCKKKSMTYMLASAQGTLVTLQDMYYPCMHAHHHTLLPSACWAYFETDKSQVTSGAGQGQVLPAEENACS